MTMTSQVYEKFWRHWPVRRTFSFHYPWLEIGKAKTQLNIKVKYISKPAEQKVSHLQDMVSVPWQEEASNLYMHSHKFFLMF